MKLTVQHVDGMRFLATTEEHAVVVDAAREDGGAGTALSAPQLFAAAVGACILEFAANSCRMRAVPFEQLSLEIECEEHARPRRIGALEAVFRIEPEPSEDVKRRLIGVARRATLVSTLAHAFRVAIRFAGEQGESDADL